MNRDRVALVIAAGFACTLVALSISTVAAALDGRALDQPAATLLATVLGAAVGALATYLGSGREG